MKTILLIILSLNMVSCFKPKAPEPEVDPEVSAFLLETSKNFNMPVVLTSLGEVDFECDQGSKSFKINQDKIQKIKLTEELKDKLNNGLAACWIQTVI